MRKRIQTFGIGGSLLLLANVPMFALGGGSLRSTQAIGNLSSEFSGPLAYGLSLIAIVGTAISRYRHHHDMGALFVGGIALGATSLLGMIPGVAGALI